MGLGLPDRDELLTVLASKAREGSVAAIKLYLEELRRDGEQPRSTLDALDNVTAIRRG
jgi:hypothetical protein